MAESPVGNTANEDTRYAVVTGANKGIGFGICKQLASKEGIVVVLTARDETRGLEALEKLKKENGFSDEKVLFHKLDVADPSSIVCLAKFIDSKFGKLDILINNAGVAGITIDVDALNASKAAGETPNLIKYAEHTYESAKEGIQINYYGAKRMTEAFLPLLLKSKSPRIVNVASTMGQLKNVPEGHTKEVLTDIDNLTEDKIDQVLQEFLLDLKNNALEAKKRAGVLPYTLSKAAMNAYTRITATKYSGLKVNSVCPGYVKTDIGYNMGVLSVEDGAAAPVRLAMLRDDGPSGLFFSRNEVAHF